jgi:hypothetical protein
VDLVATALVVATAVGLAAVVATAVGLVAVLAVATAVGLAEAVATAVGRVAATAVGRAAATAVGRAAATAVGRAAATAIGRAAATAVGRVTGTPPASDIYLYDQVAFRGFHQSPTPRTTGTRTRPRGDADAHPRRRAAPLALCCVQWVAQAQKHLPELSVAMLYCESQGRIEVHMLEVTHVEHS